MNLTLTGELFMMSDSLLFSSFFSRGVSGNIWFGTVCFGLFISFRGSHAAASCSSYSWIDFPLFHDFDSIATRITHCVVIYFQNCHTDHFFKPLKSKFTNAITYSLLYNSFPLIGKKSWQSAAIDITQHARIDHKRQQKEKFKTRIN